jgi:hypothetical protein
LCQNVEPLTYEELEQEHESRVKKIVNLGFSGVMSGTITGGETTAEVTGEEIAQEKDEIIDNVVKEMEDFGEFE